MNDSSTQITKGRPGCFNSLTGGMVGVVFGLLLFTGLGLFLLWYSNVPKHPDTFVNIPIYPGATYVQSDPASHDLYKKVTFTTTASFEEVAAFYTNMLEDDKWALEFTASSELSFRRPAHRPYFYYSAKIVSNGGADEISTIEVTMICACFDE